MTIIPQTATQVKRIVLIVEYEQGGPRIQRSGGELVGVQVDDHPVRPPNAAAPELNSIYRWLSANEFEPVPDEFGPVTAGDIGGITTFRPRRKQVYRKGGE